MTAKLIQISCSSIALALLATTGLADDGTGINNKTALHFAQSSRTSEAATTTVPAALASASPQRSVHDPSIAATSLDARQIGCLAAARWKPAVGLRERACSIRRLHKDASASKQYAASVFAHFLEFQAGFQEDIGAASAMRAYYSRVGVIEQLGWIDQGGTAVDSQLDKQRRLIEHGSAAGVDLSSLERERLDINELDLRANSQLRQLQTLLFGLTDIDFASGHWVVEPLTVQTIELDSQALVAQALRERRDLQAWRYLACNLNDDTAPMMVSAIASMFGGFGLPIPTVSCLKSCLTRLTHCHEEGSTLIETLRGELQVIIQTNEDWIRQSVIEKTELLRLAYEVHRLAEQRIDSWAHRLEQLDRLESMGQAQPDQRATTEAGLLKAQSDEVTRRLEAKLAEVALAEAVGGLASRCCYGEAWLVSGR